MPDIFATNDLQQHDLQQHAPHQLFAPVISSTQTSCSTQAFMYYQNAQGLRSFVNDFYLNSTSCFYDIVLLTETWLTSGIQSEELFDNSFNVYRCDRSTSNSHKKGGGGVLIAVKSTYDSELIDFPDSSSIEALAVRVCVNGKKLIIYCAYIPPCSNVEIYAKHLSACESLSEFAGLNDILVVTGDFNLPQIGWSIDDENVPCLIPCNVTSEVETLFTDTLAGLNLSQINGIFNNRGRLLDLIYTTESDEFLVNRSTNLLKHENIHHPAIEIIFETTPAYVPCPLDNTLFDFKKANYATLSEFFSSINWEHIWSCCDNVDDMVHIFYVIIFIGLEFLVPKKPARLPLNHPPWYNRALLKLKNRKTNAYRMFIRTRLISYHRSYCFYRKKFLGYQKVLHEEYLSRVQNNIKCNPKIFFEYVNMKRKTTGYPSVMSLDNRTSSSMSDICDLFADFFERTYSSASTSILPPINETNNENPFYLQLDDVSKGLQKLKTRSLNSPDNVPAIVLKQCGESLSKPLLAIFNRSLQSCHFPDSWKISSITPIYKAGPRKLIENYRGIAILPCMAKLMESLIYDKICRDIFAQLSPSQHGFFKGRSIVTNLLHLSDYALHTIEAGLQLDVLYVDFSKAFDRIPHDILIQKLHHFLIPTTLIKWIQSYLTDRIQFVKLGCCSSRKFNVTSGVPQGSHLGPLLFNVFINDIVDIFDSCNCLLYADDLKIFAKVRSIADCIDFQRAIDRLNEWCILNKLLPNTKKCHTMTFSRNRQLIVFDYKLADTSLERKAEVKDLGVTFDSKLNFIRHIDVIINKAYSMLGFLMRICKDFNDPYALKSIYCCLVRSILEFASTVWCPYYVVHINRLESMQKKFVLYALRKLRWDRSTLLPPYANRSLLIDLQSLESRRNHSRAMFIYDILADKIDSTYIKNSLPPTTAYRTLRRLEFFKLPTYRTNYCMYGPINSMCRAFNSVSDVFDLASSREVFKKKSRPIVSSQRATLVQL